MNSTIIHISDLHFGRERAHVQKVLLEEIDKHSPDLIIISGDFTQRAKTREFIKAKKFLDSLKYPYFVIPGNHDLPVYNFFRRLIFPWKKWNKFINLPLESTYENEYLAIYGVNSNNVFGVAFDVARGAISFAKKIIIRNYFEKIPDNKLKIVVAHHPFWLPDEQMFRHLIKGRDRAMEYFNIGGVDMILGGHIHLSYVKLFKNIIISHAGTSISNRLIKNNNNSFNIIKGNNSKLFVELYEYDEESFKICQTYKFRKKDGLWSEIN